ncbi:UDP-3-O-acyl-N-acetylglucosamine deacetylase [soil metagenome]
MVSGRALHSGVFCEVRFHVDEGPVRFVRNGSSVAASLDNVTGTERCTTLSCGGESVALVEHLLAALHVRGWWRDLVIETSAAELPILDGSSAPWLLELDALGPPPASPEPLRIAEVVGLELNGSRLSVSPGEPSLYVEVDYDHPAIGVQSWQGDPERYPEILAARTFGFLRDLEGLRRLGLATHATLENAIVYGVEGPLTPLRSVDEPVKHKALDLLGDMFLLGRPLHGSLCAVKGSHTSHVAFARRLQTYHPPLETP